MFLLEKGYGLSEMAIRWYDFDPFLSLMSNWMVREVKK